MAVEGPHAALIGYLPVFVEDVEPLGPGGVEILGAVVHAIHPEGSRVLEAPHEIAGDGDALGKRARLRVADVFVVILLETPLILRVGLADVNG